jgi:3'(2'), 5'-bisphosphate nucleotidase
MQPQRGCGIKNIEHMQNGIKNYAGYLPEVCKLAQIAGAKILELYPHAAEQKIGCKPDKTFLTKADLASNEIITEGLKKIAPDIPILSEEGEEVPFAVRKEWERLWVVDPLDGTGEFLKHSDEFVVNIALVENHRPVLGVTFSPPKQICYCAAINFGSFKENLRTHEKVKLQTHKISPNEKMQIAVSKYAGIGRYAKFFAALGEYELSYLACSIKLCFIAEGLYDVYPRCGANYEWDTAAGQCILEQAGGVLCDWQLQPLQYNTQESLQSPPFLAVGDISFPWKEYINLCNG